MPSHRRTCRPLHRGHIRSIRSPIVWLPSSVRRSCAPRKTAPLLNAASCSLPKLPPERLRHTHDTCAYPPITCGDDKKWRKSLPVAPVSLRRRSRRRLIEKRRQGPLPLAGLTLATCFGAIAGRSVGGFTRLPPPQAAVAPPLKEIHASANPRARTTRLLGLAHVEKPGEPGYPGGRRGLTPSLLRNQVTWPQTYPRALVHCARQWAGTGTCPYNATPRGNPVRAGTAPANGQARGPTPTMQPHTGTPCAQALRLL